MSRWLFAAVLLLAGLRVFAEDHRIGLWTSAGYGLLFRIDSSRILASEITSVSCLPAWSAARLANPGDAENAWVFQGVFASGDEVIRIYPGANPNTAILRRSDDMAAMLLHRVSSPPPFCARPVQDTPHANFDVFWATFAENYPFFQM